MNNFDFLTFTGVVHLEIQVDWFFVGPIMNKSVDLNPKRFGNFLIARSTQRLECWLTQRACKIQGAEIRLTLFGVNCPFKSSSMSAKLTRGRFLLAINLMLCSNQICILRDKRFHILFSV